MVTYPPFTSIAPPNPTTIRKSIFFIIRPLCLSGSPPGGSARSVLQNNPALRQVRPDRVGSGEIPGLTCVKTILDRCLDGVRIFGTTSEPGLGCLGQQTHEMPRGTQIRGCRSVAGERGIGQCVHG